MENLYQEVNSDKSECELSKEEIKYILLCLLYKVIDYLKEGYKIKFGTIFKIWLEKRDIRVNLPNVRNRIIEDRLIPKIELCRSFGYNLFQEINKDNFRMFFNRTLKAIIFIVTLIGYFVSLFSKQIVSVFAADNYFSAWYYIPILTLGVILQSVSGFIGFLQSSDIYKLNSYKDLSTLKTPTD